jgi:hypothetical protein
MGAGRNPLRKRRAAAQDDEVDVMGVVGDERMHPRHASDGSSAPPSPARPPPLACSRRPRWLRRTSHSPLFSSAGARQLADQCQQRPLVRGAAARVGAPPAGRATLTEYLDRGTLQLHALDLGPGQYPARRRRGRRPSPRTVGPGGSEPVSRITDPPSPRPPRVRAAFSHNKPWRTGTEQARNR